jgi:hypothetical protein
MVLRVLIRAGIFLVSAALGLLAAAWLITGVRLSLGGFLTGVVVFAVVQSVLSPLVQKLVSNNAPEFIGGVGLISTFIGLIVAVLLPGGLGISGIRAWILCIIVVWLVTAIATVVLRFFFLRPKTPAAA